MKALTPRQHDVLAAIQQYQQAHGYVPIVREMSRVLNLSSTCSVQRQIQALQRKGYIVRPPGKIVKIT